MCDMNKTWNRHNYTPPLTYVLNLKWKFQAVMEKQCGQYLGQKNNFFTQKYLKYKWHEKSVHYGFLDTVFCSSYKMSRNPESTVLTNSQHYFWHGIKLQTENTVHIFTCKYCNCFYIIYWNLNESLRTKASITHDMFLSYETSWNKYCY